MTTVSRMSSTPTGSGGTRVFQRVRRPVANSTRKTSTAAGRAHHVVNGVCVSSVIAPLKRDISRQQRSKRTAIPTVNRKQRPGTTNATKDEVVARAAALPASTTPGGVIARGSAFRDFLNVASRRVVSGMASEQDALRVAKQVNVTDRDYVCLSRA